VIDLLFVVAGVTLIAMALADMVNTLVSTSTFGGRWWPSRLIGRASFVTVRAVARRLPEDGSVREAMLAAFGPLLVIVLLAGWVCLQVTGFALIWWTMDGINLSGPGDAWYYSGVVYFTVGFGEIVPNGSAPRAGALAEAFCGVITVALVVGYLPSLGSAYSDRERQLMTLDAGTTDRITPASLVKAWAPDADPKKVDAQFERWEQWAAGVLETQATVPLLMLFRSHDKRQNWVTALGLLSDAALIAQVINGATDGHAYWFLRRSEAIFRDATAGVDLTWHQQDLEQRASDELFRAMYDDLAAHGFSLRNYDEARAYANETRASFGPAMEYLIDEFLCPRGFWAIDSQVKSWSSGRRIARFDQ
jgi:hypothetical protein